MNKFYLQVAVIILVITGCGPKYTTDQQAFQIMGDNYHGLGDVETHFKYSWPDSLRRQLADHIPFSVDTLKKYATTHILFPAMEFDNEGVLIAAGAFINQGNDCVFTLDDRSFFSMAAEVLDPYYADDYGLYLWQKDVEANARLNQGDPTAWDTTGWDIIGLHHCQTLWYLIPKSIDTSSRGYPSSLGDGVENAVIYRFGAELHYRATHERLYQCQLVWCRDGLHEGDQVRDCDFLFGTECISRFQRPTFGKVRWADKPGDGTLLAKLHGYGEIGIAPSVKPDIL